MAAGTRVRLLCLGALAASLAGAASLPADWRRQNLGEFDNAFVQTGWDIQPLGALVLLGVLMSAVGTVISLVRCEKSPLWPPLIGLLTVLCARGWQFGADLFLAHQEDFAYGQGFGYGLLQLSIVLYAFVLVGTLVARRSHTAVAG